MSNLHDDRKMMGSLSNEEYFLLQGWEGQLCTVDINECEEIGDVCAEQNHTKCRNTKGSYKCDCLDSYSSQNQVCIGKYIFTICRNKYLASLIICLSETRSKC